MFVILRTNDVPKKALNDFYTLVCNLDEYLEFIGIVNSSKWRENTTDVVLIRKTKMTEEELFLNSINYGYTVLSYGKTIEDLKNNISY